MLYMYTLRNKYSLPSLTNISEYRGLGVLVDNQARGKAGAGWSADHPAFLNRGSDLHEFLPCFDFFYEVIFPVNKQGSIESPQLLLV